jgi:Fur family ferric uptake transcriptional regulator
MAQVPPFLSKQGISGHPGRQHGKNFKMTPLRPRVPAWAPKAPETILRLSAKCLKPADSMIEDVKKRLDAYLAQQGQRRTKQRDVIIEAAFATDDHFNAEELLDKVRKIDRTVSRATVYRTITLMQACGVLREVDLGRDQTYYDPNFLEKPQHNHLICLDCDRVVEFEDEHIALLHDCISRRLGFKPQLKSMRIEAHCEELAREGTCRFKTAREEAVGK